MEKKRNKGKVVKLNWGKDYQNLKQIHHIINFFQTMNGEQLNIYQKNGGKVLEFQGYATLSLDSIYYLLHTCV